MQPNSYYKKIVMTFMVLFLHTSMSNAFEVQLWQISKTRPSHVCATWNQINKLLDEIQKKTHEKASPVESKITSHKNKTPRDVYKHLMKFRDKLNILLKENKIEVVSESLIDRGHELEPQAVFINSLHILDSIHNLDHAKYQTELDNDSLFKLDVQKNKTPSDAYRLINKAILKLNKISEIIP